MRANQFTLQRYAELPTVRAHFSSYQPAIFDNRNFRADAWARILLDIDHLR